VASSIAKVDILSENTNLPPNRRFRVEFRDKEKQKVSLALYREESKKIFEILRRFSDQVEKASCDEAFIDITNHVKLEDNDDSEQNDWHGAFFMGFKTQGEGSFLPTMDHDRKLYIANRIAFKMRQTID
jgi:nucleotidyltransferase/DNA polymerase involved in DNA repair